MGTKTASNRMSSLVKLYDMHTEFFPKAIDGIFEEDRHNRLNTKANHLAWIVGSMVQERYELAGLLDVDMKQKADELFKDHKGIQEGAVYPALSEFKRDWEKISPKLREAFLIVSDEKLESQFEIPEMKMTYYDMFCFMMYREANMIGQIALWRRLLGYEGMKYM